MKCLICKKTETVKFLDNYKLEIKEDIKFFNDLKIYNCEDCDFSFVSPIPSEDKLNYFYKNVYRAVGRPPYWMTENYEDLKRYHLEDKNLNYLLYLTTLINLSKIENLYDFGGGYGDLGFLLKKKFSDLKLFCTENDDNCKKILKERGYINFENFKDINTKFDLIVTTHSLEHLTNIDIFSKFNDILNPNGFLFLKFQTVQKNIFKVDRMTLHICYFLQVKACTKLQKCTTWNSSISPIHHIHLMMITNIKESLKISMKN